MHIEGDTAISVKGVIIKEMTTKVFKKIISASIMPEGHKAI